MIRWRIPTKHGKRFQNSNVNSKSESKITEIKYSMDEINSSLDKAKENINNLKNKSQENIQIEKWNKSMVKKKEKKRKEHKSIRNIFKKRERLLGKSQKEKREKNESETIFEEINSQE